VTLALSRRLLQQILWDELGIKKGNLASEIEEFLARPGVPSSLSGAIDAIRTIGNIAAHPLKDQSTREIIDVEPGEAEWLLDVLESLFDYVFVQPRRLAARRENLNQKLRAAGKPPLKLSIGSLFGQLASILCLHQSNLPPRSHCSVP
jgi:hypothetical protein